VSGLNESKPIARLLSRRLRLQLGSLQATMEELAAQRDLVLRVFVASRHATTPVAQREYWLEFSWVDQEYRVAVRRLAQFCSEHRDNSSGRFG
jgi:hypothetical protein